MKPRIEILPEPQIRLWPELRDVPPGFVLYGGTALALRLGHHTSVDFDFFATDPFNPGRLPESVPCLRVAEVLQSAANTLTVVVDRGGPVKLSNRILQPGPVTAFISQVSLLSADGKPKGAANGADLQC